MEEPSEEGFFMGPDAGPNREFLGGCRGNNASAPEPFMVEAARPRILHSAGEGESNGQGLDRATAASALVSPEIV